MPRPIPRTAVFFPTLRHWGWGAPDYVWPISAEALLGRGVPVIAVVRPQVRNHPKVLDLAARGARIFLQPPLVYRRGLISDLKVLWLRVASSGRLLRRALLAAPSPHFFIDQGAAFDFLDESTLCKILAECGATYDVFFRSNRHEAPLSAAQRSAAIAFLDRAQRTLFNSQWTCEITELQLARKLPNARYFSHLVRFPHDAPLPWPDDGTIRLASVSRLDSNHKGLDVLLQAVALLPGDLPPWTLDIVGQGPDEGYLRELAAWLGLGDRVRFQPATDNIPGVWRSHHLLVLVSRYEGLGVAMLEAMACGRPVLRTPYGGCAEWIVPGETGFVCPAPEPRLIARSLEEAFRGFQLWPAIGEAAHRRICQRLHPHPEKIYLEPFETAPPS